ncbi:MAG: PepSY-like domain-containing protein [Planctomycetes bacterium]|nr:PepSY-like domain-containing protein [Planctomycetota bacterium]
MKVKIRNVFVIAAVVGVAGFLLGKAISADSAPKLPRKVVRSLKKYSPDAEIRNVDAHAESIRVFDVELIKDGKRFKAEVVVNGEILTVYRRVSGRDLPRAVLTAMKKHAADGEVEGIVQKEEHATISISRFKKPRVQYRTMIEKGARAIRLVLNSQGRVVEREFGAEEEEEGEVEMSLDQVPEPVRKAILKHAGQHAVEEVELQTGHGRRFYEAEWEENGREVEITVAPDGTVLGREVEEDDD